MKYFNAESNDGYHNKNTDFRSYFLKFDDGARLEIMNKPRMENEEKTLQRTGYIHIAFSAGSKEKVDELTLRLRLVLGRTFLKSYRNLTESNKKLINKIVEEKDS